MGALGAARQQGTRWVVSAIYYEPVTQAEGAQPVMGYSMVS